MTINWGTLLVVGAIGFLAYWIGLVNRKHNELIDALDERHQAITAALREVVGRYTPREDFDQCSESFRHLVVQLDDMDTDIVKALTKLEADMRVLKREFSQSRC